MKRPAQVTVPWVVRSKPRLKRSKKRSLRPSKPLRCSPGSLGGRSKDAHRAGVSVSATSTDSTMAVTMVIENCR